MTLPRLDLSWLQQYAENDTELKSFIKRAESGEPVAKIIGCKGFWKGEFMVSTDVLDPRPDSETLIEAVLECFPNQDMSLKILDIGTGSGCLIVSLLKEYPHAQGTAIDISEKALKIAKKNAQGLRVKFLKADMRVLPKNLGKFDVAVSNPPYIPTKEIDELDISVKKYDPFIALDGGQDGLDYYRALSQLDMAEHLFVEIGKGQEKDVISIMRTNHWHYQKSWKDLGGIIRILYFKSSC